MPRGKILFIVVFLILCGCQTETAPAVLPTLYVAESSVPTARPLIFWQSVSGVLAPDQVDHWQFEARTGDKITLRVLGRGTQPTLTLLDSAGQVMQQGGMIQTELSSSGVYQVQVRGTGDYELGLAYTDQPNPAEVLPTPIPEVVGVPTPIPAYANLGTFITDLSHGETVSGMFSENNPEHVYTFEGRAGRFITVQLNRVTGDTDPLLTLYSPDGEPLAIDAGSASNHDAILRNIRLPSDGLYTLQTVSRGLSGGYTLTFYDNTESAPVTPTLIITPSPTPFVPILTPTIENALSGTALEDHVPVLGELAEKGDVAVYSFSTVENEFSTIGVIPVENSALIPRFEIIDPEGIPVAAASGIHSQNRREALVAPFTPVLNGTYTIFVMGEGETFGRYQIAYGVGTSRQNVMRGEARVDQTHLGAITPGGIRDIWHTHLRQDDIISVTVNTQQGALNPVLEVVSEDGTLIGIDNNSGGERTPLVNGVRIPETGLYYFRIRPAVYGNLGPYALVWRYVAAGPTATPPLGVVPILTITDSIDENAYQFYPFQGAAGQRVRVRVIADPESNLDPVLALLDPAGLIIGEADDFEGSLNPFLEMTLPSDGTYSIRINGYLSGGLFEAVVEAVMSSE